MPQDLLEFARNLRVEQTDAESLIWYLLRNRRPMGLKFRRQHPVPPYVLDFYCEELKFAVELDGGQHNADEKADRDVKRDEFLRNHGVEVARCWNHDVMLRTEHVLENLVERTLRLRPSPGAARHPLPAGEGWGGCHD